MATVTSEKNNLLALGERLRENPKTILLSIPVLGWAIFWLSLTGNREKLAGGYGHSGLTFRLLYKHHWQRKFLLKIAYFLLSRAAQIGEGTGQPTVRMVMGSVALEQGDKKQALSDYFQAFKLAKKMRDKNQAAFMQSHLGRLKVQTGDLIAAHKDLEAALKVLSSALKKDPNSLYLHVWVSNAEIGMSEWYLASGDKKQAKIWAEKVAKRAEKYDLKTRKLDAIELFKQISAAVVSLAVFTPSLRFWRYFLSR